MTSISARYEISSLLAERVALVTGAAHGIGTEYSRALAAAGARVVLSDIDSEGLQVAVKELRTEDLDVLGVPVDVADEGSVQKCKDTINDPVDILVNNAAIFSTVPMSRVGYLDLSVDEWDRMMAVNLRGAWLMARAFVPAMQARKYGKVINVSSGTALNGSPGRLHYVASKAGILGLTRTLAREVGPDSVAVNCIAPGSTLSEKEPTEEIIKMRESATASRAMPRMQLPQDLVGAVVFLASPGSDFITGQTLVVDGGNCMV